MLEFIIPTFPISYFSKDGVQYLSCPVGSVARGNWHLPSNFCVLHAYLKLHQYPEKVYQPHFANEETEA